MSNQVKIAIVVPAAGVGSRMALSHPKQYLQIAGKTVLEHTLDKLLSVKNVTHITVAVSDEDEYFQALPIDEQRVKRVSGGKERADSVLNALDALECECPDWVMVHDAARPLITVSDVNRLISQCLEYNQGGILAAKVKDTIKHGGSHSERTLPREALWQAFTPQMFPYQELRSALGDALAQGVTITDEASAMEWRNKPVQLVAGRTDNIKITTPEDYKLACFLISEQQKESV